METRTGRGSEMTDTFRLPSLQFEAVCSKSGVEFWKTYFPDWALNISRQFVTVANVCLALLLDHTIATKAGMNQKFEAGVFDSYVSLQSDWNGPTGGPEIPDHCDLWTDAGVPTCEIVARDIEGPTVEVFVLPNGRRRVSFKSTQELVATGR